MLFGVNLIGVPIGIITSIFLTRFLGSSAYGDYKFLYELFRFAILLLTFGLLHAGNRTLVINNDPQKAKEYFGAELFIVGILYLIMCISLYTYGFLDHNIVEKGLQKTLYYLIPFSWIFLLIQYFEVLFQADNKISLLANSRLYPKVGFLLTVLLIYFFFFDYRGNKLLFVWFFFLITQIIVFIYIIFKVNPSFNHLKARMREIWSYNKSYGFNVYLGSLFAVGFESLTGVLISYFGIDNTGVGYYALAITISTPLTFIPNVIATTHYKEFSTRTQISGRLIKTTMGMSIAALIFIWIIVGPFIRIFYDPEFEPVIRLTIIVSTGMIFYGFADFFNRFLGSQGKGKALRNSSFIVGASLMILNLIFIPLWGETGAAYTRAVSGIIYISCMLWFYFDTVKKNKSQEL